MITDGTTIVRYGSTVETGTNFYEWTETNSSQITFGFWDGNQFILYTDSGTVLTSTDGTNWSTTATAFNGLIKDMKYDGSTYVAVGSFGVASAATPENLTLRSITVQAGKRGGIFSMTHVAYKGSTFFAAGRDSPLTLISSDGITWQAHERNGHFTDINNLFYFRGKLIDWTPGYLFSSTNGIDWVMENDNTTNHQKAWCCEHGCVSDSNIGHGLVILSDINALRGTDISTTNSGTFICLDTGHFYIGTLWIDQIWEVRFTLESQLSNWPETSILTWIDEIARFSECPIPN